MRRRTRTRESLSCTHDIMAGSAPTGRAILTKICRHPRCYGNIGSIIGVYRVWGSHSKPNGLGLQMEFLYDRPLLCFERIRSVLLLLPTPPQAGSHAQSVLQTGTITVSNASGRAKRTKLFESYLSRYYRLAALCDLT